MSAALDELSAARAELAGKSAQDILAWSWARFGARAVIASSFGAEDVALIDLASRVAPKLEVFTLDTGRLHPETYEVMQAIRERYGITLRVYSPERSGVEKLESEQGLYSFRESLEARKACCAIRKVEPLRRALAGREAWVTGLRREQSVTRAGVEPIEIDDSQSGIWKLNPLAAWTEADVWNHLRENRVPYHALHDVGFRSIGCAPCTRAVKPYEDARAGRWWWEQPEHKECGLHARR